MSFNEWVTALVKLRKQTLATEKEEAAQDEATLAAAADEAADAFDAADFGFEPPPSPFCMEDALRFDMEGGRTRVIFTV